MAGVYINTSNFRSLYDNGVSISYPLKNFNTNINSQERFVFYGAEDGNAMFPIPCYKTTRVTIDGERVYYPAMTIKDAKAFKALRNKPFLTREDKSLMAKVSQALDKCAESYGLSAGSILINRLSDFYEYYEKSGGAQEGIAYLKSVNAGSNT